MWYWQAVGGMKCRPFGGASSEGWLDFITMSEHEEGDLNANKAACEASVKQSIRELAAWVEREGAK
jgi:hypothetical protein